MSTMVQPTKNRRLRRQFDALWTTPCTDAKRCSAAIAFFRKTVGASHTTLPRVVNVDKNPAYPIAFEAIKHEGFVRPRSSLRQCKYLNNVIEQDHRFIKRRTRPMLGFKRFTTAWRTVRGIEMMHALRKGQARWMAKGDVVGQTRLIHKVFGLAV